jgi:DNA processing protein
MPAIPSCLNNVKYLLVLLHAFSSHSSMVYKILRTFSDYVDLVKQGDGVLQKMGVKDEQLVALKTPNWCAIEREVVWMDGENQHIITFFDDEYPSLLREIHAPPILLFVKGDKSILAQDQLAIVGSRNPTPLGTENAYMLAKNLSLEGLVVTSGLALGIDAAAHRGALASSGKTIAVMGAGFDHIYPQRHKLLAQEIVNKGGAVLSEFPLSCAPLAENFPQRNRIISGLSLGTIVVEATARSGSLITAHLAAEQGREVFALPGSIHNQLAKGCHELIRQGAKLIESVQDILLDLPRWAKSKDTSSGIVDGEKKINQTKRCRQLLQAIDDMATPLDVIAARSSLTIQEIMSMLVHLELQGLVKKVVGGYCKIR